MDEDGKRKQSKLTWIIPIGIVALLGVLYFTWPSFHSFCVEAYQVMRSGEHERVEAWVAQYGAWGLIVLIGLMLMQSLLAFIPSVILMVAAVLSYGPVWGGLLAWAGLLLAASMAYLIGRSLGPVTVHRLIGQQTEEKIDSFLERYGVWAVVAARISPALSTDAVSYAAGIVGMRFRHFFLATGLGTVPLTVLVAYLGSDVERLETGMLWVSVVTAVLFIGYVVYDWHRS